MTSQVSPPGFDAGALAAKYTLLDALPPALYKAVVAHSSGDLLARTAAVLTWRRALLDGALPDPLPAEWPPQEHAKLFSHLITSTQLLRFAKGEEEIADAVLLDMLRLVDQAGDWKTEVFEELLRQLLEAEKRRREQEAQAERRKKGAPRPLDEFNLALARMSAEKGAEEKVRSLIEQAFCGAWGGRTAAWLAVEGMFGPLSNLLGLGWDLSRTVLRSTGWLAAEKLRALLERLPQLGRVIESLGRMSIPPHPEQKSLLEEILGPLVRPVEVFTPVPTRDVPVEVRGVERSGDFGRMLPSEAAMLTHPVLRMLWHARRAERALLTYEAEGLDFHVVLVEQETEGPGKRPRPAEEKGPMILCVDTSGSMAGAPETVAKAIALEALRKAHGERRRLFVYLFSGPKDVVEMELAVSKQGIGALLHFLASSFHGGTDITEPMSRALGRIEDDEWRNADILLISDGEFPADIHLEERALVLREDQRLRIHGLLVGAHRSPAMERLCTPLHRFAEWRSLLGDAS